MFKKILDSIKKSFLKGFRGGFNLSRYGKLEAPKLENDHKDLAEEIFSRACLTLNETGMMYPTFFLVKGKDFMPVLMDPKSLEEINLEKYASMVTNVADEQNAEAMFFISEQWRIERPLDDKEIKQFLLGKRLLKLDPDKQEVLTLLYLTSKGEMKTLVGEIDRLVDNTPFVRDSKWTDFQSVEKTFFQPWR